MVTRPDAPYGRGRRLRPPPAATAALELGIECYQPADVNDERARARIAAARPEAVCVCAFGAMIREPLLSAQRILNVHPSLLPRWRGAAPIERAIMAGDERTGVSIMLLVAELDAGPVCLQAVEPIARDDTYGSLAVRLAALGGELLIRALDEVRPVRRARSRRSPPTPRRSCRADRLLDPLAPAAELERVVRALTPHIGARVALPDGARSASAARGCSPTVRRRGSCRSRVRRPLLGCGDGALELLEVLPAGKRQMSGEDYLRGLHGR